MDPERLTTLLQRIDQLNSQDPNTEVIKGVPQPRELVYAQRLTAWVLRLRPDASEALRIAARGQHVRRWTIPRQQYPRARQGYLQWRETLKVFHAQTVGELMNAAGYPEPVIARVQRLMSKKDLAADPDTQTLEDALCLVFLETQFEEMRRKTPDATLREVLRKAWKKMSESARAIAQQLPLEEEAKAFLRESLAGL